VRQHPNHEVERPENDASGQISHDHGPLDHSAELARGHVSGFGGFGHFGFGSVIGANSEGQDPELRYLDDGALVAQFDRFCVFCVDNPRKQINVLALDEEHAEVDGANYLELPRRLVAVIRVPGFLESSNVA